MHEAPSCTQKLIVLQFVPRGTWQAKTTCTNLLMETVTVTFLHLQPDESSSHSFVLLKFDRECHMFLGVHLLYNVIDVGNLVTDLQFAINCMNVSFALSWCQLTLLDHQSLEVHSMKRIFQ